jgi:hypothetical protein
MSSQIFEGAWTCDTSRRSIGPTDTVRRVTTHMQYSGLFKYDISIRCLCLKARPVSKQNKHTWAHTCTWLRVIVTSSSCRRAIIMEATARMKSPAIATCNRQRTGGFHAYIFRNGYHGYALLKVWNQGIWAGNADWIGRKEVYITFRYGNLM